MHVVIFMLSVTSKIEAISYLVVHADALLISWRSDKVTRSLRITGLLFALFLLPFVAKAQAPSAIAGDGVFVQYTSGTPPLVSYGYSMFLPTNSGNTYQL